MRDCWLPNSRSCAGVHPGLISEPHMNMQAERSGPRSLDDAKRWMRDKLAKRVHPLGLTDPLVTASLIEELKGLDADNWAALWGAAGARHREQGRDAEHK